MCLRGYRKRHLGLRAGHGAYLRITRAKDDLLSADPEGVNIAGFPRRWPTFRSLFAKSETHLLGRRGMESAAEHGFVEDDDAQFLLSILDTRERKFDHAMT